MNAALGTILKSEKTVALVSAGLIGAVIAKVVPTPADALYFYMQRKQKENFIRGKVSPGWFWANESLAYYGFNLAWWLTVFAVVTGVKADFKTKAGVALIMVSTGAVAAVLAQNIKMDRELQAKINGVAK